MKKSEQEVQDHSAEYYANERYQDYGLAYHKHVIGELVEQLNWQNLNGKILDIGCGTGIISKLYPNLDITGVDISTEMLRYHPGKFVIGSAEHIPFPDEHFDAIICRSTLHHLPGAIAGLREMKRVLKSGGRIHFWETNASWLAEIIRHHTQHGDRFSEYHHSFHNLADVVGIHFNVTEVKYEGFLAYPIFGFPDITNFSRWIPFPNIIFRLAIAIDEWLSRSWFKRMGFAVRVKAVKE